MDKKSVEERRVSQHTSVSPKGRQRSFQPVAIITGITGQDGRILANLLIKKGYRVVGVSRRTTTQLESLPGIQVVNGDLTDQTFLNDLLNSVQPHEFYNFAAQSFVESSWQNPVNTADSTALSTLRCLEAIRYHSPHTRFFQAGSSELFGDTNEAPQTELTPFNPRSPYATSKLFAHFTVKNYRDRYGLFACNGIMYNHESFFRGLEFVTRKITFGVAKIKLGLADSLQLGSLDAKRDWGWAEDFAEAIWRILQYEAPEDFILATGKLHSVQDIVEMAFGQAGLQWQDYVTIDPKFVRKPELVPLVGNPAKAEKLLDWRATTLPETFIPMMVEHDIELLKSSHNREWLPRS